jgi:hypothetical protein
VHGDRSSTGLMSDLGLVHIASLATIERSALVSTAFTVEGKHVLEVRKEFRPFATGPGLYYFSDWPHHFDYVLVLFTNPGAANPDSSRLMLVAEGRHFQLYRVIKPR